MRKLWLFFAQLITIAFAILFIVAYFKPQWLEKWREPVLGISETPITAPAQSTLPAPVVSSVSPITFRHAVNRAIPAVVDIRTSQRIRSSNIFSPFSPFYNNEPSQQQARTGLGSGVIVDPNGIILTNNHVLESADDIQVVLSDGKTFTPKIIGTDPETDLAVLQIPAANLPTIPMAQPDAVQVGDVVLAIGNPFGIGQTVTMGIISALGRNKLGINTYEQFIQTDAAINPGNSGGPLIDLNGNLLGINTAIFSKTGGSLGIGFAIPIGMAQNIMKQLLEKGEVIRGWLGATIAPLTDEDLRANRLKESTGAVIARLIRGGPAHQAGLEINDVIVSINDKKVNDANDLVNQVAALEPGSDAQIQLYRDGKLMTISVKIERRPVMR